VTDLKSTSIRLPEELVEEAKRREGFNMGGECRQFLQEVLAGGHSTETALAIRRERLEGELDDAKREVERLERELEEINKRLEDRKNDRRDVFDKIDNMNIPDDAELSPDDAHWEKFAEDLSIGPRELYEEYMEYQE